MKSKLEELFALMMAAACFPDCNVYNTGKERSMKRESKHKGSKPEYGDGFVYKDGFVCRALNKKNADRKHNNWLKQKKQMED